ncbi:MAG TPA: glycosyltransferase family 4 protein [Rhizorhapis sp.]|nr:glycosyltransferase family 4 protein [Rhizorhapis sp.]
MHVAYLSPTWPPAGAANGVVTYVSAMRSYLLSQGHKVSILSQGKLFASDGSVRDFDAERGRYARYMARIRARIDSHLGHRPGSASAIAAQFNRACNMAPIDLIEMEESFGWSRAAQRRLDIPVVTRLHGPHALMPKFPTPAAEARRSRHRISAEGRAIRGAAALTAPSQSVMDAACSLYGRPAFRGEVIPNPVAVADAEKRWQVQECEKDLILFVGRFDRLKGADMVLAAFQRLVEKRPAARLVMAGPDYGLTLDDGRTLGWNAYASEYLSPEARAGISYLGVQTPEEIAILRRRANVTIVASRWENFPYAAIEAMAVGSPLISTDWPGSADLVVHGQTGWRTPLGRPELMADRICWLLANPAAASRAGAAAWNQCRRAYSIESVGARTLHFYEEILSRRCRRD